MKHAFIAIFATASLYAADPVTLTLADFTDSKGAAPSAGWVADDADETIHLVGKGAGALITKQEYSSFELEWEWKVGPGGNNGIKYWLNNFGKPDKPNWLGVEYQMIDDVKHPDATHGDNRNTASIYDIKGAAKDKVVKPAGEWNVSKIIVANGKIEHWLNGALAASADTTSEEWKAAVAKSKFKAVVGFAPGKGRLMLTEHGDETWFRKIRLKAL
ncbi:MAG: 3-keto-disaccharide hydrolase [Roseimicrobium sp.]